jgi:co-chaperonin GroES (HSP10)
MKVIGTNILLTKIEEQITNDVGIIYAKSTDKNLRYVKAVVEMAGTDVKVCKADNTVYYDAAQASEIRIKDVKYVVVDQKAIVVVE